MRRYSPARIEAMIARIAELGAERDGLLEKARGLRDELRRLESEKLRGSGCCDQTAHIAYEHAADIVTEVFDLDGKP